MGNWIVLGGLTVFSFLIAYFVFKVGASSMESESGNDTKKFLFIGLQVLGLMMLTIIIFLFIPKVVVDDANFCSSNGW